MISGKSSIEISNSDADLIKHLKINSRVNAKRYSSTKIDSEDLKKEEILNVRSQMVDWFIVVCSKLKQCHQTFFLALEIMDETIQSFNFLLAKSDLHLIGLTAIFIASKYTEVNPVSLKIIIEKIGHEKFEKQEILRAEQLILSKLNYKIPKTDYLDLLYLIINNICNKPEDMLLDLKIENIYNFSICLVKALLIDFSFRSKINNGKVLFSVVLTAMKGLRVEGIDYSAKIRNLFNMYDGSVSFENLIKNVNFIETKLTMLKQQTETFPYFNGIELVSFNVM